MSITYSFWRLSPLAACLTFVFSWTATELIAEPLSRDGQGKPPNIVFILSDDHAYQAISAYNDPRKLIEPPPLITWPTREYVSTAILWATQSVVQPRIDSDREILPFPVPTVSTTTLAVALTVRKLPFPNCFTPPATRQHFSASGT